MNCCDILVEIGRKVKVNLFHKDKLYLSDDCNNHNSEYENEVLTMNYGILRENWFDVSNPQIINEKSVVGIQHTNFLDEEFLLLEADDDKYDDFEFERVFISSSNTSDVTVSNSFTSASCEAASSMEKSKVKTGLLRYLFSHSGNSHDVTALRELNGISPESTPISTPSRNTSDSTHSRSDFLKNLSRQSSSKDTSCALEKSEEASTTNDTCCLTPNCRDAPLVDTSDANSLTEHRSIITDKNGNVLGEALKLLGNVEQKHRIKPIIHSEEEEIAFLRSLGWEKNSDDDNDEGLTLEEILDFYDKHAQNCSYDQIFSKLCIKT
ncbi:hypothetical protein P8452_33450 [Trifolium repens]|nr:hypothetical protein P8452_33450 [Trifolium repens]